MTRKEQHSNKTLLRVLLTAVAVLLLCSVFCGAAAAGDQRLFPDNGRLENGEVYTLWSDITLTKDLTVPNGVTCTIDLNGNTLTGTGSGSVITIKSGGNLTLTDSFIFNGKVTGGKAMNGGGVYVNGGGTFTMSGGSISGNSAIGDGGGVYVDGGGTFTMSGGSITGNTAVKGGGGVYVTGTFTMSSGSISGNSAIGGGGGVYVSGGGTFTISGGGIEGNSGGTNGGGVYVDYHGMFTMNDGSIEGNSALEGGGVYVYDSGTFTLSGGKPFVDGNRKTDGVVNNVCLSDAAQLQLSGTLEDGADIRIASPAPANGAAFGTADSSVGGADKIKSEIGGFFGQIAGTELIWNGGKEVAQIQGKDKKYFSVTEAMREAESGECIILIDDDLRENIIISPGKTITLDLNGYVLKGNGYDSVITIKFGGNLTLKDSVGDGKVTGGKAMNGGGVYVNGGGTFTMSGGSITGNTATDYGGGVYVDTEGMFTMTDGSIAENSAERGGGVFNWNSFTMTGGNITGNTATLGGGVYVNGSSTFTMNDGSISGNSAKNNGGGVYLYGSNFEMTGDSSISGNTADNGGGVYVWYSTFNMNSGSITGNTASSYGGGVYVFNNGTFTLSGGEPFVSGNTKADGAANNVWLIDAYRLQLTGILDDSADIRITSPVPAYGAVFGTVSDSVDGAKYIRSDDGQFWGSINDNGELVWDDEEVDRGTWETASSAKAVLRSASNNSSDVSAAAFNDVAPAEKSITAHFSANSIVESVTVYGIDKADADKYRLEFHASSGLWEKESLMKPEADLVLKPFTLKLYDNDTETPVENVSLTINFKVKPDKVKEHGVTAVRLGHLIDKENNTWEKLEVKHLSEGDGYHHFSVKATEPTQFFVVAAVKAAPKKSSSSTQGSSIWLTAAPTPTSTPTPTPMVTPGVPEVPSVKPVASETPAGKSPVPFMGILAGLGCTAVLFGLRRK